MRQAFLLTILFRVVRSLKGNPNARGRDQQSAREGVAILAIVFILAVTTSLFGTTSAVARAVGVLGLLALLGAERGVNDKYERSRGRFQLQHGFPQLPVDVAGSRTWRRQEPGNLGRMPRL